MEHKKNNEPEQAPASTQIHQAPKNKKFLIIVGVAGTLVIAGLIATFLLVRKNNQSTSSAPDTNLPAAQTPQQDQQYNWSTSTEGPYRDKVSYATSTDLLNWTDSGQILAEHASVPDVINKDGTLYMYFVDVNDDTKPEQIGLKKSTDNGKTWSETEIITIDGVGDHIPVDPAPFLMSDGRIRLYYFDISVSRGTTGPSDENHGIYSAISTDGLNFTQEEGVRFEEPNIFDPDVIKVGDTWRLYVGNAKDNYVVSATSTDGLTFTKEGIAFKGGAVPNVYYDGSQYILYTAGINIATSKDGASFTATNYSFHASAGLTADPGVVKLGDNSYLMVYKTSDVQPSTPPAQ